MVKVWGLVLGFRVQAHAGTGFEPSKGSKNQIPENPMGNCNRILKRRGLLWVYTGDSLDV